MGKASEVRFLDQGAASLWHSGGLYLGCTYAQACTTGPMGLMCMERVTHVSVHCLLPPESVNLRQLQFSIALLGLHPFFIPCETFRVSIK